MIASWGRWPPGSNEPALDPRESGERKVNEEAERAAENGDRWDGKHGKAVRVQTQRAEQAEDGDVDEVDAERRAGEALVRRYNIHALPTLLLFINGAVAGFLIDPSSEKEIDVFLRKMLGLNAGGLYGKYV